MVQDSKVFFEYVDFYAKMLLVLETRIRNSTTQQRILFIQYSLLFLQTYLITCLVNTWSKKLIDMAFIVLLVTVGWLIPLLVIGLCYINVSSFTHGIKYPSSHFIPVLLCSWGQVGCQMKQKSSRNSIFWVSATVFQP